MLVQLCTTQVAYWKNLRRVDTKKKAKDRLALQQCVGGAFCQTHGCIAAFASQEGQSEGEEARVAALA